MKKILSLLSLLCFCAFIFTSCEKPNSTETPEDNSFYYVKYETAVLGGTGAVTVNTDTGKKTYSLGPNKSYSETFGPVSKGFEASIKCSINATTYIYVSKENGPFALKASGGKSLSYTIDF